jgi:nucleoside-diphosphate-sugar epimerase
MVLVTGATGFIGQTLCKELALQNYSVRRVVRKKTDCFLDPMSQWMPNIDGEADWSSALVDVTHVVHLAARVHQLNESKRAAQTAYGELNVRGTLNLARQAAAAGVRRFIFVSSIKVNGEATEVGRPFTAADTPAPEDAYGASKYQAEQGLLLLAERSKMEIVIVRPPLVYGPGVGANFGRMIRWLKAGVPLPLGAVVNNRRSFVFIDNLSDLLVQCLGHPKAAGEIFLVSDGHDLSTTDLLNTLAQEIDGPRWLLPVPPSILGLLATLCGKRDLVNRLLGNLQVDISKTEHLLGWRPKVSIDDAFRRTVLGSK